jgi:hypothetical protein
MQTLPSKTDFSQALNTSFRLTLEGMQTLETTLVQLREDKPTPGIEQYTLLFRGPGEVVLPQHIYPIEHDTLGVFDLFLVPVSRDLAGVYYEAIISRLTA